MFLICLEVVSSFRCLVVYLQRWRRWRRQVNDHRVYLSGLNELTGRFLEIPSSVFTDLRALSSPSTLLGGCSFSSLMQPFI